MWQEYKGHYLDDSTHAPSIAVFDSVEAWREGQYEYIADSESLAKTWIDLLVGGAAISLGEKEHECRLPHELIPDVLRLINEGEPMDTSKIMKYLDPTKEGAQTPNGPFVVFGYEPPAEGGNTRFYLLPKGDVLGRVMNDSYDAAQHDLMEQQKLLENLGLHEEAERMRSTVSDPPFVLPNEAAQTLLSDGIITESAGKFKVTELGSRLYTFVVMVEEFDIKPTSPKTAASFYDYMLQLYFVLGEGYEGHKYDNYVMLASLGYLGMIE